MVLEKINDNAYKLELPADFGVSPTFNIADLKPYLGEEDELPSRTTSFQEGEDDEYINTIVTPTTPTATYTGPITRARARQLNYQVLSFLANDSNVHENMMLPKLDTFVLLTNEGPCLEKDEFGARTSMEMMACAWGTRTELQVMISGRGSHHNEWMKHWTKYTRCYFIIFVQRLF